MIIRTKYLLVAVLILLCSTIYLGLSSIGHAVEKDVNVKILIEGEDPIPTTNKIADSREYAQSIELWHYSGGYWKYNNLVIEDSDLGDYLTNPQQLENEINDEIIFEMDIDHTLYDDLVQKDSVRALCSTTLPNKKISDLFKDPKIELKNNKIIFKAKPKIHFYNQASVTYEEIIGQPLNVIVPLVDPDYGYNTYAIWKRTVSVDWGGALGYFNKANIYAEAPAGSGKIAPAQIINSNGHLKSGFEFKTGQTTRISDESSVGYYTFKNGGAVGIHFHYPIKLTFYEDNGEDLSAQFETLPSTAVAGDNVLVGIRVKSTFEENVQHVPFKWEIKKKSGGTVSAAFTGHGTAESGTIANIPAMQEVMLYASFTMPDDDVQILFELNKDGKTPEETYLDNNRLDSGSSVQLVSTISTAGEFDLDFNILSRRVNYPLATSGIAANLHLPKGSWNGNATGSLNVTNGQPDLFREFQVLHNPPVNEASATIVRNPEILTTLQRTDFGDNPLNSNWLNVGNPYDPIIRSGNVTFMGSVSRPYVYTYHTYGGNPPVSHAHTGYGSTSASFNSGTNTQNIRTYIYNGNPVIAPKIFENRIDYNSTDSLQKSMLWTTEKYSFDVIRWMFHMDENNSLYGDTRVPGQYQRDFIQQGSGTLQWGVTHSMAQDYEQGRTAARNREYDKSYYNKAVFASDYDYRNVDYPIKSGYYFNPTGEYTFTLETVHYKTTDADTQDHQDLVDAVIRSFRYQSDLVYINSNREAVNLQNEPLSKSGSSYRRNPASLTANDPTGVDDAVLLYVLDRSDDESRYSKTVEEIQHAEDANGDTHVYWKEILEGYDESGTGGSRDHFKYQEYVKDGQHMYKITERTTVTIQINPANRSVYTHAQLLDGTYTIKAWIGDIDLSALGHEYGKLGTLTGISPLDEIEVSVEGSMYEDTN